MRRNVLFDVYANPHSGHRVGFAQVADGFQIAREKTANAPASHVAVSAVAGIKTLAQLLRAGYQKFDRRLYFHRRCNTFGSDHPELKGKWLIAVDAPSTEEVINAVKDAVKNLPPVIILPEEVDHWASLQHDNESYITGDGETCLWPLVLAQVSMERGWAIRCMPNLGRLPDQPPVIAPKAWTDLLAESFPSQAIAECLKALGWTTENLITSEIRSLDDGNLSAFI